uniref:C-type lectin domain-containing protein n=1 Tax=Monopterus albus TaxID=43700 RepID=A0A3Q3JRP9_MONAL
CHILQTFLLLILVGKRQTYCPSGWTGYKGRCFRYVPTAMTWARAERNCQSMGANLASVHSADEYHEIQKMVVTVTHAYREAWLGGTDAPQEGIWLWSDGTPFNYRHYCIIHPVPLVPTADNCWDDVSCTIDRPFVCRMTAICPVICSRPIQEL